MVVALGGGSESEQPMRRLHAAHMRIRPIQTAIDAAGTFTEEHEHRADVTRGFPGAGRRQKHLRLPGIRISEAALYTGRAAQAPHDIDATYPALGTKLIGPSFDELGGRLAARDL